MACHPGVTYNEEVEVEEDEVVRLLFDPGDGSPKVVTVEKRAAAEWRKKFLFRCAVIARSYIESYERRLPPLEHRSRRDMHGYMEHTQKVYASICKLVMKADPLGSPGVEWTAAVNEVGAMTFEACMAEMMKI